MMLNPVKKKKMGMVMHLWVKSTLSVLPKTLSDLSKSILLLAISYCFTYKLLGEAQATSKLSSEIINLSSLTTLIIAYLVLHAFVASPIKAYMSYKRLGFWDGKTFHYHSEVLVYTGVIHPEGQKIVEIKFPGECKNMFVTTHTTASNDHVKAGFTFFQTSDGKWDIPMHNGSSRTGIRLDGRKQALVTESPPGTTPSRVKVYLESWCP